MCSISPCTCGAHALHTRAYACIRVCACPPRSPLAARASSRDAGVRVSGTRAAAAASLAGAVGTANVGTAGPRTASRRPAPPRGAGPTCGTRWRACSRPWRRWCRRCPTTTATATRWWRSPCDPGHVTLAATWPGSARRRGAAPSRCPARRGTRAPPLDWRTGPRRPSRPG